MLKLNSRNCAKSKAFTFIKREYHTWIKVNLNFITYIEASKNRSIIYLENGHTILSESPLLKVQNSLPIGFERIHQNYIVNMAKVCFVNTETNHINLNNGIDINYGLNYKDNIQRYFINQHKKITKNKN
jgi:DNA-binding LytR/AlgR family response regulator